MTTVKLSAGAPFPTLEVPDPDGRLKPGMFGRFNIVWDSRSNVLLVPRVAIVDDDVSDSVFVIINGKVERRPILTGYTRGEQVEVVEGLSGEEEIVVNTLNGVIHVWNIDGTELRDGDKSRYLGKGVTRAVANINGPLSDALIAETFEDQAALVRVLADGHLGGAGLDHGQGSGEDFSFQVAKLVQHPEVAAVLLQRRGVGGDAFAERFPQRVDDAAHGLSPRNSSSRASCSFTVVISCSRRAPLQPRRSAIRSAIGSTSASRREGS